MTVQMNQGIRLVTGQLFSYYEPHLTEVSVEALAKSLSHICRFAGHVQYFYSVAQHAVNCSYIVDEEHAFAALMHDTAEMATNDLPTPLKHYVEDIAGPVFKELEIRIESAMAERFGFEYPLHPAVKLADLQMLGLEKDAVKQDHSEWATLEGVEYAHLQDKVDLAYMPPEKAEQLFLHRFMELAA